MNIFLDAFLPNLFPAASVLPLSGFALLCFSREPEELSIPLSEATSDLFFPYNICCYCWQRSSPTGLALCCLTAGTEVQTLPFSAHERDSRFLPRMGEKNSPLSLGSESPSLTQTWLGVAQPGSETLLFFRERVVLCLPVVTSGCHHSS